VNTAPDQLQPGLLGTEKYHFFVNLAKNFELSRACKVGQEKFEIEKKNGRVV
jgi:hypothetical protein